jgi:hypothetical protein
LLVVFAAIIVHAHEDPRGEVHPLVFAGSDRFEVYFRDNREMEDQGGKLYRRLYSRTGEPLGERESWDNALPNVAFSVDLPEEDGRPVLELRPPGREKPSLTKPQLPRGRFTDATLLGWFPSPKFIMRDSPAAAWGGNSPVPFTLRIVELETGKILASTVVGIPGRIYSTARTSAALCVDEDIVLAWLEEKRFPPTKVKLSDSSTADIANTTCRMVLTRWQPKHRRTRHAEIARVVGHNIAIGIGRIDNQVFVAWHEWGKIRTQAVDLNNIAFVPQLPKLVRSEE